MKHYLLLGFLALSACDELEGVGGINYTPPQGYTMVTDPDAPTHIWVLFEGNRAFFREKSAYSGLDFGTFYIDYNCANQTFRLDSKGQWLPLRDLAPDSIGRGAFWVVCKQN
jgi:hypothetical protein